MNHDAIEALHDLNLQLFREEAEALGHTDSYDLGDEDMQALEMVHCEVTNYIDNLPRTDK